MAYIGREPQIGNFQVCDAISTVNNQAAYTMQVGSVNVSPETANHMLVSLNGILQAPTTSFTVSGSTITFAANLVTGDVINFIQILGSVLDLGVPSDSTVSIAKLSATGTKNSTTFLRGDNTFNAPPLGGITEADQWRITANFTSNQEPISSNIERNDSTGYGRIGTGITESSGIFSFGSTGVYKVSYTLVAYPASNDDIFGAIEVTTDNSSYSYVAEISISRDGNGVTTGTTSAFVDVTNTSNVKVRFNITNVSGGSRIDGNTSKNETFFEFIRLGDT